MALVFRVLVLVTTLVCGAYVAACGEDQSSKKAAEAALDREQALASRDRDQRIARLERRLADLKAQNRPTDQVAHSNGPLARSFKRFEATLDGSAGATVGPPGAGTVYTLGSLESASAWSTIKVPIALRVLEERGGPRGLSAELRGAVERALVASDNSAAAILFRSLGTPHAAAAAVGQVLEEAGDTSTRVSTVGRAGFSPYGQTDWALGAQHRFMAQLAGECIGDAASRRYLLALMGRVTSDTWGLGSTGLPALWKGGWGPGADGRYLARQMGVVDMDGRSLVVTLAVLPSNGSFGSAQHMATDVARWVVERGADFAGRPGRC